ncbi:PEP/pyruvate-binding domain-containing protein [Candidatus Pyrohabitans sp.]
MNIAWFEDLGKDDVGIAGGKGANLGEMVRAGLPVPPGFVVTAQAYSYFLKESGLAERLMEILRKTDVDRNDELTKASEKIRELINNSRVPEALAREILESYRELSRRANKEEEFVAVRSSATAEDLPGASFAGQQETFLNVKGEEIIDYVRRCWSSLFTPRAIFYREKKGFDHERVAIAVVVQKMVNAEKAGVMFSVHPATGEKDKIVIEAAWGLGEGVVSGTVTPDHYVVDKDTNRLLHKEIAVKEVMFTRDEKTGKTIKLKVEPERAGAQVLTESELAQLAELGKRVEEHFGSPQDIEWAYEAGKLYLLQSRPITVLYEKEAEEEVSEAKEVLVKGLAASPGIGSGKVKVIFSVKELDKIKNGDVLVTTMTNPDMVPAMKRASAIVTEEGGMTCIGAGARLLTQRGFMPIEEMYERVKRGENLEVLSLDSQSLKLRWRRVINSMKRKSLAFKLEVYEHTKRGDTIWITPDHKMITLNGRGELELLELQEVVNREKSLLVATKIPEFAIAYDTLAAEQFYLAGVLSSDGAVAFREGRPIGVRFSQKACGARVELIEHVGRLFKKYYGYEFRDFSSHGDISYRGYTWKRTSEFSCNRREPAEFLLKFKERGEEIILLSNEEEILNFLAGYVDGDGHYNAQKGWIEICGSGDDLKTLVIACLRLGVRPGVRFRKNAWVLTIPNSPLVGQLLDMTKRIKAEPKERVEGARKFAARDIVGEIEGIDHRGWLNKYIKHNIFVDVERLHSYLKDERAKAIAARFMNSELASVRFRCLEEKEIDVYNITVEADSDLDHNYVVFTSAFTPLVVGNCHAAIVSRELGIPCVVGTGEATKVLQDDMEVTVDGTRGVVYSGLTKVREEKREEAAVAAAPKIVTATEIKVNISIPEVAPRVAPIADGVGLLRVEHLILGIGKHPMKFIREDREKELIDKIAEGVRKVAQPFYPKPVWYRTLDAPTDEFRGLEGGEDEPVEHNPMLGWRGIRRAIEQPELLRVEFKAIKKLVDEGYNNIGVMIPLVQHPEELRRAKEIAREVGLEPHRDVKFGIMVEIPAAALIIEDFIREGIDFISFGTNDLTQYTLAVDRNNERVARLYTEKHPAVMKLIKMVIKACRKAGVETSICGQAGSYPEVARRLVEFGISSISANPDAVQAIREMVARTEMRLLLDRAREG